MGHAGGVLSLVRRWRQWQAELRTMVLRWRIDGQHRERAVHPGGIFAIEDGKRLVHEWPGWGTRPIVTHEDPEKLRSRAQKIARGGGPIGAPATGIIGAALPVRDSRGIVRRPVGDGSEVRSFPLDGASLAVRVWPSGMFIQRPLVYSLDKMYEELASQPEDLKLAECLKSGSRMLGWTFRDFHPVLGLMRTTMDLELLLCAFTADLVAVLAVRDELRGIYTGTWDEIRACDFGDWIQRFPPDDPAAPSTSSPTDPGAKTKTRRARVATAPGPMPAPKGRVRLKPELAEAVVKHLADVAGTLPSGVLGAAVAVELLRALQAAALAGHPTLSGRPIDLLSLLHKKGFLSAVPADQAARAALKLLAARTPLVRRLHYRRWCFAFGELQDPASPLRAKLGLAEPEPVNPPGR